MPDETWQRRESGLLTVEAYHAVGGIRDAVAASAERLYDGLTDAEQAQLRWLMLHLVSLSESGEPYRTPMSGAAAAGSTPSGFDSSTSWSVAVWSPRTPTATTSRTRLWSGPGRVCVAGSTRIARVSRSAGT